MADSQNILYEWDYDDTRVRSPRWYIIALSIAIGLIIWGFITRQYGMSIVIMLLSGLMFFLENNSEDEVHVSISDMGIKVQDSFYDYSRINSYSFVYHGEDAVYLRLFVQKSGIRVLNIKINNEIAKALQNILPNYITEDPKQDVTFLEKVIHILQL